ncbi:unnamed protein product, partial [Rotaria sp. Silwood1]
IELTTCPQGSNGSSICSGIGGKESSSISSFDEYLLNNHTLSSSYTKETPDSLIQNNNTNDLHEQLHHDILNNISSMTQIQHEIDELKLNENITTDDCEQNTKLITNQITKTDKEKTSNGKH